MNNKRDAKTKSYYIGLIIIHILLLSMTLTKKKDRKTIFLTLLSIVGFAFHFEYPLYILKAYRYRTGILNTKEKDNSFGSVLSQALFVPSVAIFISAFQLGWKVKILFTFYFVFIERLFIKVKIFKNNWWHTSFTAFAICTFFFVSDVCYKGIKKSNKLFSNLTLYHSIHLTYMSLLFSASLFGMFRFTPTSNTTQPWYEHYSFTKVYLVIETVISTFILERKKKWLKVLPLFIIVIVDRFLLKMDRLKVKGSYWLGLFPIRMIAHLLSFQLQRWIKK
ncbi:hypothetical protein [Halalkalibacter flavus]|uniref:hypothetical protein n=1 Tax=Halalkalibacter flavus TaxID=3090668 RepID=UPI002FCA78DA